MWQSRSKGKDYLDMFISLKSLKPSTLNPKTLETLKTLKTLKTLNHQMNEVEAGMAEIRPVGGF